MANSANLTKINRIAELAKELGWIEVSPVGHIAHGTVTDLIVAATIDALRQDAGRTPTNIIRVEYRHPDYHRLGFRVELHDGKIVLATLRHGRTTVARSLAGILRYLNAELEYARIERSCGAS